MDQSALSATQSTEFSAEELAELIKISRDHADAVLEKQWQRYAQDNRFYFDEAAAKAAVDFFPRYLVHSIGEFAGKPFYLENWQKKLVMLVFGFKWKATKARVVRQIFLFIPRKNGKSTFAAGLALALLIADGESAAQVYSVASDKDQAKIVFGEATQMVLSSPELTRYTEVFKTAILCGALNSTYQVITSKADTKHGQNAHGILFDEIHTQPNRDLYDVLLTGMVARRQPLMVCMSTAGHDVHNICGELHDYSKKINDGVFEEPSFLPVIFEADADDDWTDPKTWAKANPSLNVGVKVDVLAKMARDALRTPSTEATFRRLHLNQWVDGEKRWLDVRVWDQGSGEIAWHDLPEFLLGRDCYGGLDISSKYDITAFTLMFPPVADGKPWHMIARYYLPRDKIRERVDADRVPYDVWARQGAMTLTDGNVVDQRFIKTDILEMAGKYNIREIAFDPWNAHQFAIELQSENINVVEYRLGYAGMNEPTKFFETLVASKMLCHGGHPITRWMASNTVLQHDNQDNVRPSKRHSREKIDGVVAGIMALGRAIGGQKQEPAAAPGMIFI